LKIVPDTSVIISRLLITEVLDKKDEIEKIILPKIVLSEIENMANEHKAKGFEGLQELKDLRFECNRLGIEIVLAGERPTLDEIKLASSGELDAKIRDVAKEEDAVLYTSDRILLSMCEAEGIAGEYLMHPPRKKPMKRIFDFFDDTTMSVHLRENVPPLAKKGHPGNWRLVELTKDRIEHEEIDDIVTDILAECRTSKNCFIEMNEPGVKVIQLENMRIVIAQPPFADALEITAVKPITKLSLKDYKLSENLHGRLKSRAEGVLIAGSPGAGKSTFAQALADFYAGMNKTVKTIEKPRDLQVGPEVSQYTSLKGDFRKTADVMLLIRPDYVIFDELRKTEDFKAFADMRLAGIGLVGVIHSTEAIEAVQRFIGRIDLGMIPSILDTIIFVKEGGVKRVLELRMTVKVPSGMQERDLARPVIEVFDFESHKLVYDIFVFGEQVSVIPVGIENRQKKEYSLSKGLEKKIKRLLSRHFDIEKYQLTCTGPESIQIHVPSKDIPHLIGKQGKNITKLERKVGMRIDVQPLSDYKEERGGETTVTGVVPGGVPVDVRFTKSHIVLNIPHFDHGINIEIATSNKTLFSGAVGKQGTIKIERSTSLADKIVRMLNRGETIYAKPK
jgi:ATPase